MSKSNRLLLVSVLVLPAGCVDYLNHYDTVTLAAGDSNRLNRMLQTESPFNERAFDTDIHSDGARVLRVMRKYQQVPVKGAAEKAGVVDAPAPVN